MKKTLEKLGNIYVILMLVGYPLILTDKYYNVTNTKLYFFLITTIIFAAAVFSVCGMGVLNREKTEGILQKEILVTAGVFLASVFIPFIFTQDKIAAFKGTFEYGFGAGYLLVLLMGFIALTITGFSREVFTISTLIGGCIVGLIGLMHFIGIDVFGLISSVTIEDRNTFISTLGNTSFFGFYMLFIFPIAAYSYIEISNSYSYLSLAGVVISAVGAVIANTDATVLGLVVEMLVIIIILSKDEKSYSKGLQLVLSICISYLVLNILLKISTNERELSGIPKLFINPVIWLFMLALLLIIAVAKVKANKQLPSNVFKILAMAGLGLICVMPIVAVLYTKFAHVDLNSPLSRALYLDLNWGNRRGFIWSASWQLFEQGSIIQKLFGRGISTFAGLFWENYYDLLQDVYQVFYNDSHNMFLQWIVEFGIISGIVIVVGLVFFTVKGFKSKDIFDKYRAVALIGTAISASCLITQNVTPVFLIFLISV